MATSLKGTCGPSLELLDVHDWVDGHLVTVYRTWGGAWRFSTNGEVVPGDVALRYGIQDVDPDEQDDALAAEIAMRQSWPCYRGPAAAGG